MNARSTRLRGLLPRLITIVGLAVICMGATSRSCSFGDDDDDDDDDDTSFNVSLELMDENGNETDRFEEGENIEFVLRVTNNLEDEVEVEFDSSRQTDFVVLRPNSDDVVWQASDDQNESPGDTSLFFEEGETKTFRFVWDQRLSNGRQIADGTYDARGVMMFDGFDSDPRRDNQQGSQVVSFSVE